MQLFLKKINPTKVLADEWHQIVNNSDENMGMEVNEFEATWTFSQFEGIFEANLKVCVKPPLNFISPNFIVKIFVDQVVDSTLVKLKKEIEE